MKTIKTAQEHRKTYRLYDENGAFVTEYSAGIDGVTEADILALHQMDDHEVYVNSKENRYPEWFRPVYEEWKDHFSASFREQHGRDPKQHETPRCSWLRVSIESERKDNEELGDSSRLSRDLAAEGIDMEDSPVTVMRELVAAMPDQWQSVYQLVYVEERKKSEAAQMLGISNARVTHIIKSIAQKLSEAETLKKYFR